MRILLLIFILLSLARCATNPPSTALNRSMSWHDRASALAKIQSWNIKALLAVRTSAGNEGGSANIQWQQNQQHYTLTLFGPLGAGAVKIFGQPQKITLETADGKKFTASSPEFLLTQQTGWQLPVSNLYYWIRGLPVPGLPARMQFDAYHHLVHLYQQGWTIDFLRYSALSQLDVPTKISLYNWRLRIKIIISQWEF